MTELDKQLRLSLYKDDFYEKRSNNRKCRCKINFNMDEKRLKDLEYKSPEGKVLCKLCGYKR